MRTLLAVLILLTAGDAPADLAIEFDRKDGPGKSTQVELYKKTAFSVTRKTSNPMLAGQTVVRFDKRVVWIQLHGRTAEATFAAVIAKQRKRAPGAFDEVFKKVKKAGQEKVAGYDCTRYELGDDAIKMTVWATKSLSYPLKDVRRAWKLAFQQNADLPAEVQGVILKISGPGPDRSMEAVKVSKKRLPAKLFAKPTP